MSDSRRKPCIMPRVARTTEPTGQLAMALSTWGGRRSGSGRKPAGTIAGAPHAARPALSRHTPVHVTLRVRGHVWNLRSRRSFAVVERALAAVNRRPGFGVVHFSVQGNHLHLVVEACDRGALSRGVRAFGIRLALGLNRMMGRRGPVFADRFHAHVLRTPAEARNALAYVLDNFRSHASRRGERPGPPAPDRYASTTALADDASLLLPAKRPSVVAPQSWLLRSASVSLPRQSL